MVNSECSQIPDVIRPSNSLFTIHPSLFPFPFLFALLLSGCASPERIPVYRWTDSSTALRDLAARAAAVKTVSAQAQITLTRSDGQSVRLDGALAMQPPDSVRLRAWKLGQAVFDLTLTPGGVWMVMPQDEGQKQRILPAGASAARMAHSWAMFSGEFFVGPTIRTMDTGGGRFAVERVIDGQKIRCEIDRSTLTPRLYTVSDSSGVRRFTLIEDHYVLLNNFPWPTHLHAASETGLIDIQLHDVELNGELPSNAFMPPHRAQKLDVAQEGNR